MTLNAESQLKSWTLLLLAVTLFVIWIGFLFTETILTANPVILSRPQILAAPIIVKGRPNWPQELVEVLSVSKGELPNAGTIHVENLDLAAIAGELDSYYFPLAVTDSGSYRLVGVPDGELEISRTIYPVYPATPEVQSQLHRLLTASSGGAR